jgi:putative transposase
MGQSLTKNYVHIIFSTKQRNPIIIDQIQNDLFNYIGGICKGHDCNPIQVGGYYDHIHILCVLSKNIALMQLIKEIKQSSSKWIKTQHTSLINFYWQNGYGAFSVDPTKIDIIKNYISNQAEHHRKMNFQQEFLVFLKKYQVEYDEKYIWD